MIKQFEIEIKGYDSIKGYEVEGYDKGPCLSILSGVHGAEYVGPSGLFKFLDKLEKEGLKFKGKLIIIPLVNESGFYKGSKQIVPEDGKNLNNSFPGDKSSKTGLIAAKIEEEIYPKSDFLIDLHGGDINEEMVPLLFFPKNPKKENKEIIKKVIESISTGYLVPSTAKDGLYSYANLKGLPSLLIERGGLGRWREDEKDMVITNILQIMKALEMFDGETEPASPTYIEDPIYLSAPSKGIWHPFFKAGDFFKKKDKLGELKNLRGEVIKVFLAEYDGVLLYQNISLGVSQKDHLIAYGKLQ